MDSVDDLSYKNTVYKFFYGWINNLLKEML